MPQRPAPDPRPLASGQFPPADGGCACGAVRFRVTRTPMFVHCCHCTRCQRETGGPFAHHAMVEFTAMELLQGQPEFVKLPTDSGATHWVARCPQCRVAMWNEWGSRSAVTRYVRVGVMDEPVRFPPQAHIYVRSKQPWVNLAGGAPAFDTWYEHATMWPATSRERYAEAKQARERQAAAAREQARAAPRRRTG